MQSAAVDIDAVLVPLRSPARGLNPLSEIGHPIDSTSPFDSCTKRRAPTWRSRPFSLYGGEGSRTPVRRYRHTSFYGCSHGIGVAIGTPRNRLPFRPAWLSSSVSPRRRL